MSVDMRPAQGLRLLYDVACSLVQTDKPEDAPDFTLRQIAMLLAVYLEPPPHTVRGLAKRLGVTKPVITRALDTMGKHDLVTRERDPGDRRNVIVQRTTTGTVYVDSLGDMIVTRAAALSSP